MSGAFLVLSDFDGTITTHDVTNVIWDEYGMRDWRRTLLGKYRAGVSSTLDLMDEGWRVIAESEAELVAFARARIGLRDGFEDFVGLCRRRDWPLHVVSCGLDWYLRAFLPAGLAFTCYAATLGDRWRVHLPPGIDVPRDADFKVHVLDMLRRRYPSLPTVFIGDGRNDFPIARAVDLVFAIEGSTLARLCRGASIPCVEVTSFDGVAQHLLGRRPRGPQPVEERVT